MWLIDTRTLKLVQFQAIPEEPYAILSHRWGLNNEEVTFDEFKERTCDHKIGFKKIEECCRQALMKSDLKYAWVDTCCIDKRNLTELSEAINSMFEWYARARICFVYLDDISSEDYSVFIQSLWFTRGWTLQELIAPRHVLFFSQDWKLIGSKNHLHHHLTERTGIPIDVLESRTNFRVCSIAQRMSWASKRVTTRIEDSAYCLFGIFDVNIPLIYGEGSKAFLRLQEAIVEQIEDESIFAWTGVDPSGSGLFAPSVASFADSGDIHKIERYQYHKRPPIEKTSRGWLTECEVIPCFTNTYLVPLRCTRDRTRSKESHTDVERIAIFMCRTSEDDQYRRIQLDHKCITTSKDWEGLQRTRLQKISPMTKSLRLFVPNDVLTGRLMPHSRLPLIKIESNLLSSLVPEHEVRHRNSSQPLVGFKDIANLCGRSILTSPRPRFVAPKGDLLVNFELEKLETGVIIAFERSLIFGLRYRYYLQIGFDTHFDPVCILRCGRRKWHNYVMLDSEPNNSETPDVVMKVLHPYLLLPDSDPSNTTVFSAIAKAFHPFLLLSIGRFCLDPLTKFGDHQIDKSGFPWDTIVSTCRGDRIEGLEETVKQNLPWDYGCVEVQISLRPQEGHVWHLSLRECSPHKGYHCYGIFCQTRCFRMVQMLIGPYIFVMRWLMAFRIVLDLARAYALTAMNTFGFSGDRVLESIPLFITYLLLVGRVSSWMRPAPDWFARARFALFFWFIHDVAYPIWKRYAPS